MALFSFQAQYFHEMAFIALIAPIALEVTRLFIRLIRFDPIIKRNVVISCEFLSRLRCCSLHFTNMFWFRLHLPGNQESGPALQVIITDNSYWSRLEFPALNL